MQNGFTFETGTCLLYLFQGWIIDTRAKYMGACAGTFFAAMATQVSRVDVRVSPAYGRVGFEFGSRSVGEPTILDPWCSAG